MDTYEECSGNCPMEDHRTLLTPVKGWKIRIQKHKQIQLQKHEKNKQIKHHNDNYKTGKKFKDNFCVSICKSPDT